MNRAITFIAALAVTAAVSAPALAEGLSDRSFLDAAKCRGLISASGGDTAEVDALIRKERASRMPAVLRSAQNTMTKAAAVDAAKATAERDGACKAFVANKVVAAK